MRKKKESVLSNTKIAIIFFIFLALIAGISLSFKVVDVIRQGRIDSSKNFSISVTNGKNVKVISLSPSSKEIVIFKFDDRTPLKEAGRYLEIPIDGFVVKESLDLDQKVDSLFAKTIINYSNLNTNLTVIDLVKLAMMAKSVPANSMSTIVVKNMHRQQLDQIIGNLLRDPLIERDNQTIQIVNGTEINGLGNRLAKFVTNIGGDVIMVTTEEGLREKSIISYFGKKTYTVERLGKLLGYEAIEESSNKIADITIVVGEDKIDSIPF